MGEKMKTHPTMATAVAAAQLEMSNALKDSSNSHFRNQYASLASVRDVVVRAYAANGVAVVQEVIGCDGQAGVKTTLYWQGDPDKPRESMPAGDLMTPIGSGRNTPQECGSLTTYYRRYMLAAAGGIAQEDDDAQSVKPQPQRKSEPQRRPEPPKRRAPPNTRSPEAVDWKTRGDLRCPKCAGDLRDNIRQRARAENERPAISCGNQKCGFTEWSITNAIKLVEGMNKAPAANGAKGGKYDQSDFGRF